MKLSAREEIAAPDHRVFAALTDFDALSRVAEGRGVTMRRTDDLPEPGLGMAWTAEAAVRGQMREIVSEVTEFAVAERVVVISRMGGVEGTTEVDLTPIGSERTRLRIAIDLRPISLTGRILIQPMRMAKGSLQERFRIRIAGLARFIEAGAKW